MATGGSTARRFFATNVRAIRDQKGISQERLAQMAGLHRTYIGAVERGERNITVDNMERIAIALGVQVTDLLGGGSQ